MHKGSLLRMEWFVENYIPLDSNVKILDVGSFDVNGSYKTLFEGTKVDYLGLDVIQGTNVDYVPKDPYNWIDLEDESFDYIISGNTFEHIEYPWLTMCEMYKKLKPYGYACVMAPSSLEEHRYPIDCYRFFSDGFNALAKWAGFSVVNISLGGVPQDNFSSDWYSGCQNDTMMILAKGVSSEESAKLPKLEKEVRFYQTDKLHAKCHFLVQWINTEDKKELLNNFLRLNNIESVCLYGFGEIGKIIYREMIGIHGINVLIMDRYAKDDIQHTILRPGDCLDEKNDIIILCSLIDPSIIMELETLYPQNRVICIDSIFNDK